MGFISCLFYQLYIQLKKMPAAFVTPANLDSIAEDARLIRYSPVTETKPIVTAAINYSLASTELLNTY